MRTTRHGEKAASVGPLAGGILPSCDTPAGRGKNNCRHQHRHGHQISHECLDKRHPGSSAEAKRPSGGGTRESLGWDLRDSRAQRPPLCHPLIKNEESAGDEDAYETG
ncbi:hypothetical protein GMDG_01738 [Pseudogymnoascus destructans 20631-21]|uniref:Uncharacterized protein n=1 Tax=Pseudogymnoascus destructans (strain ATCC MYA-4855 / 20631-21) TaxID=658429 RepID=L8FY76_PSED2|nr:hypothetical protein GMDG_01738 [Pseudogymnoascus destructans 20631-21]